MEKDALWLWLKNHAQSPFPSSFTCATEGNSSPLMWFWYSTENFFQLFQILMMAYFQKNIIWTFGKLSLLQAILFEKMNLKPPNGEYDVTVFQWCLWKTNTLSKVVKYIVEIRNFGHLDRCPKFYWCIFIGSKQDCKKKKKNLYQNIQIEQEAQEIKVETPYYTSVHREVLIYISYGIFKVQKLVQSCKIYQGGAKSQLISQKYYPKQILGPILFAETFSDTNFPFHNMFKISQWSRAATSELFELVYHGFLLSRIDGESYFLNIVPVSG